MTEIVKYHNDMNKVSFGEYSELQQNLLFGIISEVRDKGNTEVFFTPTELRKFVSKNCTDIELLGFLDKLRENLIRTNFRIIRKVKENDKTYSDVGLVNLFSSFWIRVNELVDENDNGKIIGFEHLRVKVNPEFAYLVNELKADFLKFELEEFILLESKYAKSLYRLLKQYRHTGYMRIEWNELKRLLGIPSSYQTCDIEKQILKPATERLSQEQTLLDQKRTPFKNLDYTKIKGKGRGRGGNIVAIEFRFDTENSNSLQQNTYFSDKYQAIVRSAQKCYLRDDGKYFYINRVSFIDNKILVNLYDSDLNKYFDKKYTQEEFESKFMPFVSEGGTNRKIFKDFLASLPRRAN